jgi:ATP-dependent DNA helicase Q4
MANESRKKGKTKMSFTSEPYHAGLSAFRRKTVQTNFMSGRLRIVVATVAFGMGIDKSDIRAIIHYNMPKTFESYIQEIGRSGRDGLDAHCHLFLDPSGNDLNELRRHIFSNSVDPHTIRDEIHQIFLKCFLNFSLIILKFSHDKKRENVL